MAWKWFEDCIKDFTKISGDLVVEFLLSCKRILASFFSLCRLYGLSGILVALCGSSKVWRVEAQIIGIIDKRGDEQALEFKESVQKQCSMIAIHSG
jgi:hypothetical protein